MTNPSMWKANDNLIKSMINVLHECEFVVLTSPPIWIDCGCDISTNESFVTFRTYIGMFVLFSIMKVSILHKSENYKVWFASSFVHINMWETKGHYTLRPKISMSSPGSQCPKGSVMTQKLNSRALITSRNPARLSYHTRKYIELFLWNNKCLEYGFKEVLITLVTEPVGLE